VSVHRIAEITIEKLNARSGRIGDVGATGSVISSLVPWPVVLVIDPHRAEGQKTNDVADDTGRSTTVALQLYAPYMSITTITLPLMLFPLHRHCRGRLCSPDQGTKKPPATQRVSARPGELESPTF
jgi:hypothetical protein